ncbi:MAG: asparagine synthase (glutamine-hydrolyzing) [Chloroflexi bacterium]|nr:asparagine synthase (glutamine-hydrolyzing) [Chloroflexota bacterium]
MCGICGIINFKNDLPDERVLHAMNHSIAHRGPDGAGVHLAPGIGLAMRRLSIVDLVTGDQPIYNEDRSAVIVYNGEIYNHLDLRARLESLGHVYRTHADTESILHAYDQYGVGCLTHLRGMFGLAIWDEKTKTLLLARDRLGEKPLYYAQLDHELIFASEIKALLQHPRLTPEVDEQALDLYLTLGYVPAPHTMFKGVRKLPPAHRLIARDSKITIEPYWDVTFESQPIDEHEAIQELRKLFTLAVEERLMSDVPLGAYLSGGVDSTLVVGLMSSKMDRAVDTYSVGFDESYNPKFNTDAHFAKLASQIFKTNHHPIVPSKNDSLAELIPQIITQMDEPLANPNALATYLVSRQARADGLKVLLTGDGGDELFAGYERYQYDLRVSQYQKIPGSIRAHVTSPILRQMGSRFAKLAEQGDAATPAQRYLNWHAVFNESVKAQLLTRPITSNLQSLISSFMSRGNSPHFQDRLMLTDLKMWLAEESNMRVDKSAMLASIETRAPFLSHPLVEFASKIPLELKLRNGSTKYLLKKAFADLIPKEIAQRPKQGFASPASRWLRGELRELVTRALSPHALNTSGYFDPNYVGEMLDSHLNKKGYHLNQLWSLMTFQIWFFKYIAPKDL